MKRTAFTMIELIFVIVILGILASVAIPKLASVQDDAVIATEKAVAGAARSGISVLRGKRLSRGGDYNITITDVNSVAAGEHSLTISTSATFFPTTLNSGAYTDGATDAATTSTDTNDSDALGLYAAADQSTVPRALMAVVEADGIIQWANAAIDSTNAATTGSTMEYTGPAGAGIADVNAEIHNTLTTQWIYNDRSGTIVAPR